MSTRFNSWNIQIYEDHSQAVIFSQSVRPAMALRALNERHIPFVNNLKYLGVTSDKKVTYDMHTGYRHTYQSSFFVQT
jgi:hypothetical protein